MSHAAKFHGGQMSPWPLSTKPHVRWQTVVALAEQPDADMLALIAAVQRALEAGLYYNDEVYSAVVKTMADRLTPAILESGKDRAERGHFGSEIYYARKYIDALNLQHRLEEAVGELGAHVGMPLGPLIFNDLTQTSACVVTRVDVQTGLVTLQGKRGRRAVELEATALSILRARARYNERRALRQGRLSVPAVAARFAA